MALTFADTHNMIAYLTKSYASERFNQIIDFLNASSIKYALTVNPNIYVSVIKQFWSSVAVKKVNDVSSLQALVDMKKVIITEAIIRDALCLDDTKGIECLPNEEIFTELARMGYEKPSTKLTFYKAFFSSQWKFLIHTILQCMSAKRTSLNEFSSSMTSAVICLSTVGDLSSHTTKYSSFALTQKVFANMRRVKKGCSGVETPLFEGMIVEHQVGEGTAEVHVEEVSTAGVAAEGAASATDDEVPAVVDEPSIPSPPPPTQPPPPSQDIPSTSQVQPTPPPSPIAQPPSPQHQSQPSQDTGIFMDLLQNILDTCTTLTRRVEHLEQDKIAQALEITKLKQRVKKLERRNKASKLRRLKKDVDIEPAELEEVVEVVTTAKLITEVVTAASATLTAAAPQLTTAAAPTLTTAPSAARRRKGVVIRDPEETNTPSTIVHSEAKSMDKGKGILVEEPKPLKNQAQIEQDEAYARELEAKLNKNIDWDEVIDHVQRKEKEDNVVNRYQALKRKPQTQAQVRKNMMIYLRNVVGFKMDYFKGMTYDDIRPIFEKKFNSNKLDEEVEELRKHLQIVPNEDDDVYTEATPLARKVPVVDYEIYTENNKPYYKIIRADRSPHLFLSFLSLLRNFD
uniref:Xylulose kinase-1 n=1 Tax=Tanacetum cinerariifolium TaxID=118510 RepID=A0A6L2LIJ4_TANCI|nr:hypothetical protein [Tanacetum cinerariifolium]